MTAFFYPSFFCGCRSVEGSNLKLSFQTQKNVDVCSLYVSSRQMTDYCKKERKQCFEEKQKSAWESGNVLISPSCLSRQLLCQTGRQTLSSVNKSGGGDEKIFEQILQASSRQTGKRTTACETVIASERLSGGKEKGRKERQQKLQTPPKFTVHSSLLFQCVDVQ